MPITFANYVFANYVFANYVFANYVFANYVESVFLCQFCSGRIVEAEVLRIIC